MEFVWIKIQKSCTIKLSIFSESFQILFRELFEEIIARFIFIRSKGGKINKPCDIGIIVTCICNYFSTIRMSHKNCWSANQLDCTLYSSNVVSQRMKWKLYSYNSMACIS